MSIIEMHATRKLGQKSLCSVACKHMHINLFSKLL